MIVLALFLLCGTLWLLIRLFQSGPMWGRILVLAVGGTIGLLLLILHLFMYVQNRGWRQRWRVRRLRGQLAEAGREPRYLLAVCPLGDLYVAPGAAVATNFRNIIYLVYEELPHRRYSLEIWLRSAGRFAHGQSIDLAHLKRVTIDINDFEGSWMAGQVIELSFDNGDPPIKFLVPGGQRDTLHLPWRLQEISLRRIRISDARRQRRARRAERGTPHQHLAQEHRPD